MATWPPYVDDDGTGTTGTVADKAFFDAIKAYIDPAATVDVPFDPANYSVLQGTGTWTLTAASQASLQYQRVNPGLSIVTFTLAPTGQTMTGAPVTLGINLPTLPVARQTLGGTFHYYGTAGGTGFLQLDAGTHVIKLLRDIGGTTWAAAGYWLVGQLAILH